VSDPKLIQSALSRTVREDGTEVRIDIYRLETTDWSLEVVDETGTSTVWDDLFPTDQAALDEALKTIREEGIRTFLSDKTNIVYCLCKLYQNVLESDRGASRYSPHVRGSPLRPASFLSDGETSRRI